MSNSSNEKATTEIHQEMMRDKTPYEGALMGHYHKTLELMNSKWFGDLSFSSRERQIKKNWDGYTIQPRG